jgi:exodeoxyribonuclease-3
MLRIITLNLNGIRSAWRRGLLPWAADMQDADIVCVQELRADATDLSEQCGHPPDCMPTTATPAGRATAASACGAGRKPDRVIDHLASAEFDAEGRYLRADFGRLSVVSLYQPSGSSSS